ncbi:MAG: LptA/OstA family protein [Pseudomonadota bacterium]
MAEPPPPLHIKQAAQAPLQIDARGGLKCDRKTQKCTAKNNVRVQKGIFVMHCDELTAFLHKQKDGKSVVRRIDARGKIRFTGAPGEKGSATRILYDLGTNSLVLTGHGNKLDVGDSTACLNGWWPVVQREQHVLCGQTLTVHLYQRARGRDRIKGVDAEGGVVFSTPIEFSTSDSIVYNVATKQAVLRGDVIVDRREGQVKGPFALLDMSLNKHQVLRHDPFDEGCELAERPMAFVRLKNIDRKALKPKQ